MTGKASRLLRIKEEMLHSLIIRAYLKYKIEL